MCECDVVLSLVDFRFRVDTFNMAHRCFILSDGDTITVCQYDRINAVPIVNVLIVVKSHLTLHFGKVFGCVGS